MSDQLVTREEAAAILGIGLRQLHRYHDEGRLTVLRNKSGHVRYDRRQVEEFKRERDRFQ